MFILIILRIGIIMWIGISLYQILLKLYIKMDSRYLKKRQRRAGRNGKVTNYNPVIFYVLILNIIVIITFIIINVRIRGVV